MKLKIQVISVTLATLCLTFSCKNDDTLITPATTADELNTPSNARTTSYLDYGLYWFNKNGASKDAYDETNGTVKSVSNSYYNASKPTVIYFHGWQNGTSQQGYKRENFQFVHSSQNVNANTVKAWKNAGWNVGIFYWNQFADEIEVKNAEAKIWSHTGPKKMRYRQSNGNYSQEIQFNKSVSELAFQQFKAVVGGNTSRNIRLVGHSLGNQLATAVCKQISDAVANGSLASRVMPERLALLDPFWSRGGKGYLGDYNNDGKNDWTGERVRWYIREMINENGIAVEWYKTSAIFDLWLGDQNTSLEGDVMLENHKYWYLSAVDIVNKHIYARHTYFGSL